MKFAVAILFVQLAGAQEHHRAPGAPQGEVSPEEEQRFREASKNMPKEELDRLISEIKARRHRELHPTIVVKAVDALPKLLFRGFGLAVRLLVVLAPIAALWAFWNREYQTLAAATCSSLILIGLTFSSGKLSEIQPFLYGAIICGAALAIPIFIRLVMLKPKDLVLDLLLTAAFLMVADSLAQRSLPGAVYAIYAFMLSVIWGEGRAIVFLRRGKRAEAAHCIAYAALASNLISALSAGFGEM